MSHWVMGILGGVAAVIGLFMAAAASDAGIFWFGLTLVVFGVLFAWWMIKIAFDEAEAYRAWLAAPDPGDARGNAQASASRGGDVRKAA